MSTPNPTPLLSEAIVASCAYNEAAAHLRLVAARLDDCELADSLEDTATRLEALALATLATAR